MPEEAAPRRRVSAPERRSQLVDTAVSMARRDGVSALTLSRVAEANGVSKPVAYNHFESLSGLLWAVYAKLNDAYEETVVRAVRAYAEQGPSRAALLERLISVYIDCSVDDGALLDEVARALIALDPHNALHRADTIEQYRTLVTTLFGIDEQAVYPLTVAFLGALDRMCDAILAKRVTRDAGIRLLVEIFAPSLSRYSGQHETE